MKTETCKLYSRVCWIFLPNVSKINPYNTISKLGHFLRHSVQYAFHRSITNELWIRQVEVVHDVDKFSFGLGQASIQPLLLGNSRHHLTCKRPARQNHDTFYSWSPQISALGEMRHPVPTFTCANCWGFSRKTWLWKCQIVTTHDTTAVTGWTSSRIMPCLSEHLPHKIFAQINCIDKKQVNVRGHGTWH